MESNDVANQQIQLNLGTRVANDSSESQENIKAEVYTMFNFLSSIFLISVTLSISFFCFNGNLVLFSWHPSLMCLGYLCFMSQAITTFSHNYFTNKLKHQKKLKVHWILQVLAVVSIVIAFAAIYINKERNEKPHFQSYHGILGATTVGLSLAATLGGAMAKYSFQLKNILKPIYTKILHSSVGIFNYCLAIATVILGVFSAWFENSSSFTIQIFITILILFSTIIVLSKPINLLRERISNELRKNRS